MQMRSSGGWLLCNMSRYLLATLQIGQCIAGQAKPGIDFFPLCMAYGLGCCNTQQAVSKSM